jgi:hypothetical protein
VPRFTRGLRQTGAPEGSKPSSRQCQSRHRQQFRRKRNSLTAGFCAGLRAANSSRARRNALSVTHLRYPRVSQSLRMCRTDHRSARRNYRHSPAKVPQTLAHLCLSDEPGNQVLRALKRFFSPRCERYSGADDRNCSSRSAMTAYTCCRQRSTSQCSGRLAGAF